MGERREKWEREKRDREFKKNRREFAKMRKNRPAHTTWADLMNQRRGKSRYGKRINKEEYGRHRNQKDSTR